MPYDYDWCSTRAIFHRFILQMHNILRGIASRLCRTTKDDDEEEGEKKALMENESELIWGCTHLVSKITR